MKKILLVGTGGTIASEMTDAGLVPELNTKQLLKYIPQIKEICEVDCIQVCNIDSTNMAPKYWMKIAAAIKDNYAKYDGFVISHGTDTMAYTAAVLSYLIQNSAKPIVLTGAQKPINMEITDSKTNLADSFLCAVSEYVSGVLIVFNGKVIRGTRARKTHSKSFQAFSSINYPAIGIVQDGILIPYIRDFVTGDPVFYEELEERVALLKLIPNTDPGILSYLIHNFRAVMIESFGVGGIPSLDGTYYELIEKGIKDGKTIVMTTQVQNEGSDLGVYFVGHQLKNKLNVIEAYDMTTEAVAGKLMWILGQTSDQEKIRELFYKPVNFDILYQECPKK